MSDLSPHRVLGWCRVLAAVTVVPRPCRGRDDAVTRFLSYLMDDCPAPVP